MNVRRKEKGNEKRKKKKKKKKGSAPFELGGAIYSTEKF
jgi:hypothetical protein